MASSNSRLRRPLPFSRRRQPGELSSWTKRAAKGMTEMYRDRRGNVQKVWYS